MKYTALEKISVSNTVDKISYIKQNLVGKVVLDIGAYDETAVNIKDKTQLMHYIIASVANRVIGFDTSDLLPEEGIKTTDNSRIEKGSIQDLIQEGNSLLAECDVIFAGELIEHLPDTPSFFQAISSCKDLQGKYLYITTPNGMGLYNFMLGLWKRESNHRDHLHMYTYKTLNTQCIRANFSNWKILPYHVAFPEMINSSALPKKFSVLTIQKIINVLERIFPLLSGGWIVRIKI